MNSRICRISELPDDLQVLVSDFVEACFGAQGFSLKESPPLTIRRVPVAAFPRVKMWTDYRDRAYSEAMVGQQVPPVLICGDYWLDGRNRVWAARCNRQTAVDCIDLSEIGVRVHFKSLGKLRWKQP